MIVNSFQIDEALQLKPLSVEELSEARTTADARIWIDLQGFEPSEFEDCLPTVGNGKKTPVLTTKSLTGSKSLCYLPANMPNSFS